MSDPKPFDRVLAAIDKAEVALAELDANCCVPGRSPRMAELADTLSSAREGILTLDSGGGGGDDAIVLIEDAGAQIGSLQVGCRAPSRLPLYAEMLTELTAAQRTITRNSTSTTETSRRIAAGPGCRIGGQVESCGQSFLHSDQETTLTIDQLLDRRQFYINGHWVDPSSQTTSRSSTRRPSSHAR